jgi:hypothetical protein
MIFGLFATGLGKGTAGEKESGQTAAVMEPPVASPPASRTASASEQATGKAAPSGASGVAQPEVSQPAAAKACPQCGSTEPWGMTSWCPNCFYNPRLGPPVAQSPQDAEGRHPLPGDSAHAESYVAAFKSIPLWAYGLGIGIVSVFVLSLCISLKLPKTGYERAIWTVIQGSIGLIAAATAHVMVFFKAIPNTDKYGPFDLFIKPLDFWRYAIRKLPSGAWRLWMFSWGLTAAFCAFVLIGGIRYSSMFETKSKKKSTWYQTSQIVPDERRAVCVRNG